MGYGTPFEVPPGLRARTPFSPPVDPDGYGIWIAAPETVEFDPAGRADRVGNFAYVPISLSYHLENALLERAGVDGMTVVATSTSTGRVYSAKLEEDDPAEPPSEEPNPNPPMKGMQLELESIEGYYTFNLLHFLELPPTSDRYRLHVTLETFQSNVIEVAMARQGS
ncbi:MAG: hypothetical protein WEF50_18295 [Myxococcota bacterium]